MSIVAWIIVGIVAGWIADNTAERSHDLLTSIVIGMAGALIGGFLSSSLLGYRYVETLHVRSVLLAAVGAVVLFAIFRIFRNRDPEQ